ncbi:hypothetical protein WJX77_001451 [Trebouxia sp. C0004]
MPFSICCVSLTRPWVNVRCIAYFRNVNFPVSPAYGMTSFSKKVTGRSAILSSVSYNNRPTSPITIEPSPSPTLYIQAASMDNKSFTKHGLVVAFDEVWTSMRTETGPATTGVHVYITKDRKLQGHLRKAQAVANARAHELPLQGKARQGTARQG